MDATTLIRLTEIAEKLIFFVLLGLSIWSVSIIIDRRRFFQNQKLGEDFAKWMTLLDQKKVSTLQEQLGEDTRIAAKILRRILKASHSEGVDRLVSSLMKQERLHFEKGLAVLATLGANAPFIGLFGTVLGIIRSFNYLGTQSGSEAVMTGVSQALYATAMGLFVAIPAVISFNFFSKKIKDLQLEVESLRDLYTGRMFEGNGGIDGRRS